MRYYYALILIVVSAMTACGGNRVAKAVRTASRPTVVDMFKAAYPYTDDEVIKKAYDFIVNGQSSNTYDGHVMDSKKVDTANGYLRYYTGGDPGSTVECCCWRCNDGKHYLLAINVMGESPDISPTRDMLFFKYDTGAKTVQKVSAPYNVKNNGKEWSFQLPQRGKNIKVIYLNEEYAEASSFWLKWNGNSFVRSK
jgi:hypothetical protein